MVVVGAYELSAKRKEIKSDNQKVCAGKHECATGHVDIPPRVGFHRWDI